LGIALLPMRPRPLPDSQIIRRDQKQDYAAKKVIEASRHIFSPATGAKALPVLYMDAKGRQN
jgi:hypothetical protein